jgi:hypothetical protein
MNQRARSLMKRFALAGPLLSLAVTFSFANSTPPVTRPDMPSIGQEDTADLKLKVLDGATKKPIRNTGIEIYAPNEIWCRHAPCPGDDINWSGKTDAQGVVTIPGQVWTWSEDKRRYVVRRSVTITAAGYSQKMLDHAQELKRKGKATWVIGLHADRGAQSVNQ